MTAFLLTSDGVPPDQLIGRRKDMERSDGVPGDRLLYNAYQFLSERTEAIVPPGSGQDREWGRWAANRMHARELILSPRSPETSDYNQPPDTLSPGRPAAAVDILRITADYPLPPMRPAPLT